MRSIACSGLLWLCHLLDLLPGRDEGRWYRHGCLGCRVGIASFAEKVSRA